MPSSGSTHSMTSMNCLARKSRRLMTGPSSGARLSKALRANARKSKGIFPAVDYKCITKKCRIPPAAVGAPGNPRDFRTSPESSEKVLYPGQLCHYPAQSETGGSCALPRCLPSEKGDKCIFCKRMDVTSDGKCNG